VINIKDIFDGVIFHMEAYLQGTGSELRPPHKDFRILSFYP
jgi:hypothetical protein